MSTGDEEERGRTIETFAEREILEKK